MDFNSVTVQQFLQAVRKLPEDKPLNDPKVWYRTQKEHWIGWLSEYRTSNVYGRKHGRKRDARFVYNHIVEYRMLVYLAEASQVDKQLISTAKTAMAEKHTLQGKAGVFRKHIPWPVIAEKLFSDSKKSPSRSKIKWLRCRS